MISLKSKITIPDTLFLQKVDDETILLDTNTQEYFSLNESGSEIWELLSINNNLEDLKKMLLDKYDVEMEKVEYDILKFIEAIFEKGLIEVE